MSLPTVESGFLTLIGLNVEAFPITMFDKETGERQGYDAELASAIALQMGLQVKWKVVDWSDFRKTLEEGGADGIWCGQSITPARQDYWDFARPYGAFDECLLVPVDSDITDIASLAGKTVGGLPGTTNWALGEAYDKELGGGKIKLVEFPSNVPDFLGDMVKAMDEGKIDAVVEDEIAFSGYIDSGKYRAALGRPTQQRWAVPFPKSRPEAAQVREAMNKAMAELASKGTLAEIWNKWFGQGQFAEYFGVKAVPVCLTSEWSE